MSSRVAQLVSERTGIWRICLHWPHAFNQHPLLLPITFLEHGPLHSGWQDWVTVFLGTGPVPATLWHPEQSEPCNRDSGGFLLPPTPPLWSGKQWWLCNKSAIIMKTVKAIMRAEARRWELMESSGLYLCSRDTRQPPWATGLPIKAGLPEGLREGKAYMCLALEETGILWQPYMLPASRTWPLLNCKSALTDFVFVPQQNF